MLNDTISVLNLAPDAIVAAPGFLDTARLEFQASLQLLADRACWVIDGKSAAVALKEDGILTYCAVSGRCDCEPGAQVAADDTLIRECLDKAQSVEEDANNNACVFRLIVPVLDDGKASGFLELISERQFSEELKRDVLRIAELVSVALEHRNAAEHAANAEFQQLGSVADAQTMLWHASQRQDDGKIEPAPVASGNANTASAPVTASQFHACAACGFPVSTARSLCVDCERKPENVAVPPALFSAEPQESWLSTHGYTIASLIVTLLTTALILWLRR
jgi:hypothetical protein